nr:MAG TPA: hypothetical protein [Caudoviricetes sp.]
MLYVINVVDLFHMLRRQFISKNEAISIVGVK